MSSNTGKDVGFECIVVCDDTWTFAISTRLKDGRSVVSMSVPGADWERAIDTAFESAMALCKQTLRAEWDRKEPR